MNQSMGSNGSGRLPMLSSTPMNDRSTTNAKDVMISVLVLSAFSVARIDLSAFSLSFADAYLSALTSAGIYIALSLTCSR